MCTGYLAEQIEDEFQDGSDLGAAIEYSRESVPLRTAGALKLAQRYVQLESKFLVLNGDCFWRLTSTNLSTFIGSMAVWPRLQSCLSRMQAAMEQCGVEPITVCWDLRKKPVIALLGSSTRASMFLAVRCSRRFRKDLQAWNERSFPGYWNKEYFAAATGLFIDIGTPDDYARAREMCDRLAELRRTNTDRVSFAGGLAFRGL